MFMQENSKDLLGEFLPGGMFYLPAKDEKIDLERVPKDKVESKRLSKLKLVGMFLSDDDAYVLHEPECGGLYAPTKLNKEGFAKLTAKYEDGNRIEQAYYGVNDEPCLRKEGFAKWTDSESSL